MQKLCEIADYVTEKIPVAQLNAENYITTDNMLPNRNGITTCESLPQAERVTKFISGDV